MTKKRYVWLALSIAGTLCGFATSSGAQEVTRNFEIAIPLFSPDSAWNQRASEVAVAADSEQRIQVLYRVLRGDQSTLDVEDQAAFDWPYMDINYNDYSVAIGRLGTAWASVPIIEYEGAAGGTNPKLPIAPDGRVRVPAPVAPVRPAGPQGIGADGHLVLYRPDRHLSYDYWQATTLTDDGGSSLGGGRIGSALLAAGTADLFNTRGPGTNPPGMYSARAAGVPLLAGLILPEDVESGRIAHALAFALPGMRNTANDPEEPLAGDAIYPAATTETSYINRNPLALAGGERIRLRQSLVDGEGEPLDETALAPITRMFLAALRDYGAYVIDNAGGFSFYAEDIHTAKVDLGDDEINKLIGALEGTPLPAGKSKWQLLMERLLLDLESIPLAYGPWSEDQDPATATVSVSNFDVVEPARIPANNLAVAVWTEKAVYAFGERLEASLYVNNPAGSSVVDFFFGLVGPDGDATTIFTDFQFNGASVSLQDFSDWLPIVGNIDLRAPFVYNEPSFFSRSWNASEPAGNYLLFIAAAVHDSLRDGTLDTGDLLALDTVSLSIGP